MKRQTFEERLFGAKCIDPPIGSHEILLTFYSGQDYSRMKLDRITITEKTQGINRERERKMSAFYIY